MKIIISNPLALNKLQRLKLIYPLFSLDIEFFTDPELGCYLDSATRVIYDDLCVNKQIRLLAYTAEEMRTINAWCRCFPRLSRFEVLSLYLAKREAAGIFATQHLLREAAESIDIQILGYDWLFDYLNDQQVFHSMEIFNRWIELEKLLFSFTASTRPEFVRKFYHGRQETLYYRPIDLQGSVPKDESMNQIRKSG
ncbi:MAG: hypothetical protein ACOYN5_12010 [Bacteroidales bacterium]